MPINHMRQLVLPENGKKEMRVNAVFQFNEPVVAKKLTSVQPNVSNLNSEAVMKVLDQEENIFTNASQ